MTTTNTVQQGDTVVLHYKGTLDDGTTFDSSYDRGDPMTVLAGAGQLIAGFDKALNGMGTGETKTFTLTPEEAYGPRNDEAKTTMGRTAFPDDFELSEGLTLPLMGPNGQQLLGTVTSFTDSDVEVDLNHPMAGKNLTFEVTVVEINSKEEETTT